MTKYDLVSILVPTKKREKFTENILRNFYRQDYPNEHMELIIGDEGPSNMKLLLPKDDNIRYYNFDKISLGNKRNKLCELAKGEILIFMDDDDFYPIEKVSECVKILNNSKILITGSSVMYVYFTKYNKILKYGPYGIFHATCGTFAFKKKYIENNKFLDLQKAEERSFLNNYKNELIQMNSLKSILVIAHSENTVDKYKFFKQGKKTNLTLDNFGLTQKDKDFYNSLN